LSINGAYNFPNNAEQQLMAWFTVDGPVSVTSPSYGNSITNTGNGGNVDVCPGTSGGFKPVYGFRDSSSSYSSDSWVGGNDQSPYPFNNSPQRNVVNCGSAGRVVYYLDTSRSAGRHDFGFVFNLANGRTAEDPSQPVCINMYVSMNTRGNNGAPWFPPSFSPTGPNQQSAIASRFAAQGNRICFNVINQNPMADFFDIGCRAGVNNYWFRFRGHDRDYPDFWTNSFRIARKSNSNIVYGPANTNRFDGTTHNGYFLPGNEGGVPRYKIQVRDINTAALGLPGAEEWVDVYEFSAPACNVDHPVTGYIENHTCNRISIAGIRDLNDPGVGVRVVVRAYPVSKAAYIAANGLGPGVVLFDGRATDRLDLNVPEDLANQGWEFNLYIYNIGLNAQNNPQDKPAFDPTNINQDSGATGPCYNASCSIDVVEGAPGLPEGGVFGGKNFTFNLTIYNTGWPRASVLPDSVGGAQLTGSDGGGDFDFAPLDFFSNGWDYVPRADQGSNAVTRQFSLYVPADINTRTLSIYPDYYGRFGIGPACTAAVTTYLPFRIEPSADTPVANPDSENPESINYTGRVNQVETGNRDGSPYTANDIPATISSSLIYYRQGVYRPNDFVNRTYPGTYGTASNLETWTDTIQGRQINHGGTVDTWSPGDKFCARVSISPGTGWLGPGGDIRDPQPLSAPNNCGEVQNRPYIRAYGADVFGGGQFGTAGGSGSIQAYYKDSSGAGSGAEFAALAIDTITGFTSASLRAASAPLPPDGLTFANVGDGSPGNFVGARAVTDYFADGLKAETQPQNRNTVQIIAGTFADKEQTYIRNNRVTFNPGAGDGSGYSKRHAFFVEGDVLIRNDIVYNTSGWASIADIPSFALVVKGNIYIDKDVSRLDGMYVAQPNGPNTGKIYTCSNGFDLYVEAQLYGACNRKLEVNGAFVAQQVKFLRTFKTLSDVPFTPGNPIIYGKEQFGSDNAAESFRLPPEYYLARPVFRSEGNQAAGKYDYFVTLPPIL
jgi:hypothetical protein